MATRHTYALLAIGAGAWLSWLATTSGQTTSQAAIPNLAGKVLTVQGPIDPDQLGHTLMHEHIFIDLNPPDDPEKWRLARRAWPAGATERQMFNAPLTLRNLGAVTFGAPNRDNYLLDDEKLAIEEVSEFRKYGGGTIVDVTSIGLKRNPEGLRRVSIATGLHVVMGASWYTKAWHPKELDDRSVESLTDEIVRDVTIGVEGTGIRSGVIGEVGTMGNPLTPNEIKVIRASGRASRLTGAPVSLHTVPEYREQLKVIDLLQQEGTDLSRVAVGHSDWLATDMPFMQQMLQRGVLIQFDILGRPPILTRRRAHDTDVAAAIVKLIEAGYLERIVLSHDVCTKTSLKAYGGTGYSFVEEVFLPYLRKHGVTDAQIHAIMVENPKRLLTFVAPQPAGRS